MDALKGKWKQLVGEAKIAWGRLTQDEVLRFKGRGQKWIGLIQERYAISRDEAVKRINKFFKDRTS